MTFSSAAGGKGRSYGVEFQPIAQIHIEINEQCANVAYVKACLQKKWDFSHNEWSRIGGLSRNRTLASCLYAVHKIIAISIARCTYVVVVHVP